MNVCPSCGNHNADSAEFCASCRTYLGWEGERRSPPPAAPVSVPTGSSTPAGPGPAPTATIDSPHPPNGGRAGAAPALEAGTAPAQPAAERPAPPPTEPAPAARRREQGEQAVYCGACGTDNDVGRTFCRSCGGDLFQRAPARLPWWRRVLRRSAGPVAGERPGRRHRARARRGRRATRTAVGLALAAAVAVLAFPARPGVLSAYRSVKARFVTTYEPVKPVSASATSSARGSGPARAIDGVKNTAWAEGAAGLGTGQWLQIVLDRTVDLARVGITPGASDNEKAFRAASRPAAVRLEFSDGTEQKVSLRDEPAFQTFDVAAKSVRWVRLELLSAYRGQTSRQDTSIAEVEFFTKK